jgi:hypothetical protein
MRAVAPARGRILLCPGRRRKPVSCPLAPLLTPSLSAPPTRLAALPLLGPAFVETAFVATTAYALALYSAALLAPQRVVPALRAHRLAPLLPLALLYLALLGASWRADTLALMLPGSLEEGLRSGQVQFLPSLSGVVTLLSRRATAASAWAHLLCVNAFAATWLLRDAARARVPVRHSLLLSLLAGPLGLASHLLTRAVVRRRRRQARLQTVQ